mmetsp:Transcript_76144/g.223237  ORF Transcript_76144/g.223237 Transcript_76144/m.223237 type:complete len:97 (-) Transcript_76144:12-302(-)
MRAMFTKMGPAKYHPSWRTFLCLSSNPTPINTEPTNTEADKISKTLSTKQVFANRKQYRTDIAGKHKFTPNIWEKPRLRGRIGDRTNTLDAKQADA